jgi:tRNA modification GTPase
MNSDTIAAIITAPGEAGVSIVRISGNTALAIADKIIRCQFPPPSQRPPNSFLHGYVKSPENESDLDEVIVLVYRAPHSYTREDVVEFQGHGGRTSARRILRTVIKAGARLAEPGEFTKRAFLNGRIDLLQAEAVMDLIKSHSDRAANAAIEQLEGSLSSSFNDIYNNLVSCAGDLEATLDFGEDELPAATFDTIMNQLQSVQQKLRHLLDGWDEGHLLREGALVVISGSPNVGKSTLLNAMLGSERAIVTHLAGTTRDVIEEQVVINGIPIRLVDTAGLRSTDCNIEQEGIRRAQQKIERADLNLIVIDGSQQLSAAEKDHIISMKPSQCLIVINKCDLSKAVNTCNLNSYDYTECSLVQNKGVTELRSAIGNKLGIKASATPHAVISERHRNLIINVMNSLREVISILASDSEELTAMAAEAVRDALEELGSITGRNYHAELLDNIFGRFCVGK